MRRPDAPRRREAVAVPEDFARLTAAREGERGLAWLAGLPALAGRLLRRWDCEVAGPVAHGEVGIVVPVRRADGAPAALKVSFTHPGNVHEPDAFAVWEGRGAVLLLERDDAAFAMLLEHAGPGTLADLPDTEEAVAEAGRLLRRLAVPAPPGLPRLADLADRWEEELRANDEALGRPMSRRATGAALAAVAELAGDQPAVMVHGDLHFRNVLRGAREPWLAIDPKGLVGDPAYDTFSLVRASLLDVVGSGDLAGHARRRVAVFAEAAGLDAERALRWTQLLTVRSAHWHRAHDRDPGLARLTEQLAEQLL
ncbi:aminoglycoside phosphotransferase family protein [Streptomyces marincola]|uniref:aminoglycoside phosphotransferase family protein n=1 Tax=Streptomyces marincola TaxID=2878388 RepID=UPI001CF59F65|nr:aminoglycoside phosphotransferase family protein [Streptomyces marincola]UCM87200.1 aminoglycoside phosphotransferase family protein [Streptomyces marincola]